MLFLLFVFVAVTASVSAADEFALHSFKRHQLSDTYFSEGAAVGDLNADGIPDLVYGPYWFEGPDFREQHEIYKPVPQDMNRYADNFFTWVEDFNADGFADVLVVGLPGTPAFIFENPQDGSANAHWQRHRVMEGIGNESPEFIDVDGDGRRDLVCAHDGFFGFATYDPQDAFESWDFHAISEPNAAKRTPHGLGIGDINSDGRMDLIHAHGWYEQPESNALTTRWRSYNAPLTSAYGGAEMYAYDVDGDGDNDIITSNAAHDFGLGWYEQVRTGDDITFKYHRIMGAKRSENQYGALFSELHSVHLADIDGDGLQDIVTGKTYWSHHRQSPMWDAGAVVYWFKLVRDENSIRWVPHLIDAESGVGRQIVVEDVNADGLLDVVVGGMKGGHVLLHQKETVAEADWNAAQPKVFADFQPESTPQLRKANVSSVKMSPRTGRVAGAIEAETLTYYVSGGNARPQDMRGFSLDRWSGQSQLWWTGAQPGDSLTMELPEFSGTVDIEIVLTGAKDYGIVQLYLDDQPLGTPIDLYQRDVKTTGVLKFSQRKVDGNQHTLGVKITGSNPSAIKSFMFAIDYVRVKQADGNFVQGINPEDGVLPKTADGRTLGLDFESGTLADWTATGDAFRDQPVQGDTVSARRNDMQSDHEGEYWIGGYERHGDEATGTLTSSPFVVSEPFATFLAAGGKHDETRVELVEHQSGDVFFAYSGSNSETLQQVVVDVKALLGKEAVIRLIDEHQGGWGHINFDHFRLHKTRPAKLTPPKIVLEADEYPHAGLPAAEAAEAMKVPAGFQVTVGAAEPDVQQPVAMAIDDRGRVWIAEAFEYPVRAKGDQGRDRILIFEDTDGNGSLDKRTVFAEGLNLVSGLEVGFGGVWVGAAPYLMFIPDRNGDDIPDSAPEILLDGWGYQDTHETLNAFIWGPDGWLYGCHGVFTHSRVGKPGTPDEERVPVNAAVWRYHPTRHQFDVFAHGTSNPWGVDFNDHGQAFITACVIPHLYHVIEGARYQRQGGQHFNPYTYRDITTIADHLHYLGANPHGGNNRSDSAGGGHAHAGAMIYLGDAWPEAYRGELFMNNIHGQRLNVDRLQPRGSGYVGTHGPDFLLTGDQASQILNLRYGPDGNAWMIDWYDMQACHRREVNMHDRSNGRIYKISYSETAGDLPAAQPAADPFASRGISHSLAEMSDRELAELVLQRSDWFVRHARRLLQERALRSEIDLGARSRLREIAVTHADDTRRLRAVWALHAVSGLDEAFLQALLNDPSPYVRGWTVQLAMEVSQNAPSNAMLERFIELAQQDPSPVVRLYLASAAQNLDLNQRWGLIESLCSHASDANDHNLPLMYWYAAEPLADVDASRALALAMQAGVAIPLVQEFMLRRIGSADDAGRSLEVLVQGLGEAKSRTIQIAFLKAIRLALRGQRRVSPPTQWGEVSARLIQSDDEEVSTQAIALGVTFGDPAATAKMREQITDGSLSTEHRLIAIESLLGANDPELVPSLITLLDEDEALREAAIRGMAQYDSGDATNSLLARYDDFTPEQRRLVLGTLCSRASSGLALLRTIEAKQIPSSDLTADLVRQLQLLQNQEIGDLLTSVWGSVRESDADKLAMIARYKELVESDTEPPVNLALGRAVFAKTCMKCHVLYGVGFKIGPDLTGSNRSNLDYLLSNIVDPSGVMAKEYLPTILLTDDGRVVSGLVKAEDNRSITIQSTDAVVIVPKNEIEERILSEKSMMPEDQLKQFSDHEVRSLIAYLRGKEQTPMLASDEDLARFFNGTDLTGWSGRDDLWSVENGELVGRTDGLAQNEWIVSDLAVGDFTLTLDVKLVGNRGNSGIQFRSHAHDGEVAGYQADIGVDWWGKLYEEHGRGLLWDQPADAKVNVGEWNRYKIVVSGHHIRTYLNDELCVDLEDPDGAESGIIAFQLHSGGKTEVRFRNIQLTR